MTWWDDDAPSLEKKEEYDYVLEAFAGVDLAPGWNRRACPRCRDTDGKEDGKASLGLKWPQAAYNCFRCGMHGALPSGYRVRVQGDDPMELALREREELPPPELELCEGFLPAFEEPGWSTYALEWARQYLLDKRGLTPQACYEAGVGAVVAGRLAGRIVVPIPDYTDASKPWRGWVAREALGRATSMPYRYAKGMVRIGLLYNEPSLYVHTERPCYIVEGTLDALALWPDAVAVLGTPIESQFDLFLQAQRPLVVCLDGDAWEKGRALSWKLRLNGKRAGNIRLAPKQDPDEVDRAWLDEQARVSLEVA